MDTGPIISFARKPIEMNPIISVVIPAYNVGPYVEIAIRSILNQTFSDLEVVVCDDGSTDNTWEVINSIQDNRLRKYRNQENLGYLKTYNFLLKVCLGQYITFQDADDWSDVNRLGDQLLVFEKFSDISMVACNGSFYYSDEIQRPCPEFTSGYIKVDTANFQFMLPSTMVKREVLEYVGGFHEYFDGLTGGDQYFILEILSRFKGYQLNKYYYFARFNPTSNHRTLNNLRKLSTPEAYFFLKKQRVETGSDWLREGREDKLLEYEESLLRDAKFMAEKYREYAVYRIDSNRLFPAVSLLLKSFSLNPFHGPTYRTIAYWLKKLI